MGFWCEGEDDPDAVFAHAYLRKVKAKTRIVTESDRINARIKQAFKAMKCRCETKSDVAYKYYGGRGIKVCFTSWEELLEAIGPPPTSAHTVDRINSYGNYEAGNVRWATMAEQHKNRRPRKKKSAMRRDPGPGLFES